MYYNVYIGYTLSRVACVRVYFINTKFNNVSDATKLLLCTVHRRVERREICYAKYQPIVLNSSQVTLLSPLFVLRYFMNFNHYIALLFTFQCNYVEYLIAA